MIICGRRNTGPERAVRSLAHAAGLRYRVSQRPLPGVARTADLLFASLKVAVFVDGCFWHGCPMHYRLPSTNTTYWGRKIERNRERDLDTDRRLADAGWEIVRVWEHERPEIALERLLSALERRPGRTPLPGRSAFRGAPSRPSGS